MLEQERVRARRGKGGREGVRLIIYDLKKEKRCQMGRKVGRQNRDQRIRKRPKRGRARAFNLSIEKKRRKAPREDAAIRVEGKKNRDLSQEMGLQGCWHRPKKQSQPEKGKTSRYRKKGKNAINQKKGRTKTCNNKAIERKE